MHPNHRMALLGMGYAKGVFPIRGEMNKATANWLQSFLADDRKGLLGGSVKQESWRHGNWRKCAESDAMAIGRTNPAAANFESIRSFEDRVKPQSIL